MVSNNSLADCARKAVKPSKGAESHINYFFFNLNSFGLRVFVDDVKRGIVLGLFALSYRALGPNVKAQCFVCLFLN